jgi:hypothetical protein
MRDFSRPGVVFLTWTERSEQSDFPGFFRG